MGTDPTDVGYIGSLLAPGEVRLLLNLPPRDAVTLTGEDADLSEGLRYKRVAPDLYAGLVQRTDDGQAKYGLTALGRRTVAWCQDRQVRDRATRPG